MKICIVEDQNYQKLYPLTKTRPVFDLKCGSFSLAERILKILSPDAETVHYIMRPELEPVWKLKNKANPRVSFGMPEKGRRLILNGRILFDQSSLEKILSKTDQNKSAIWLTDDTWAAMFVPQKYSAITAEELVNGDYDLSIFRDQTYLNTELIVHPWDLITHNSTMIRKDYAMICKRLNKLRFPPLPDNVAILKGKNLKIGKHAEIYPFVTFDGTRGPIIIGDNVTIEAGAFIQGPVSIGDNCLISANTKIYQDTTLGNTCKVGGEISHSIIHGFSNKRHSGFLGNSYLGEWVNLGAGTNNSNLKNNYNKITVSRNGEEIDTGSQFVGLFMGDHSRSAISTTFNTATFVGVGCNIFGDGFPPKHVDDFTWGGIQDSGLYDFQKFIQNARRMMIRREKELSDEEVTLLRALHHCRTTNGHNKNVISNNFSEENPIRNH